MATIVWRREGNGDCDIRLLHMSYSAHQTNVGVAVPDARFDRRKRNDNSLLAIKAYQFINFFLEIAHRIVTKDKLGANNHDYG
jgi:hypothetical protein